MKLIAVSIITAVALSACCKADCIGKEVFVDFRQFKGTETDTVWVIRYKPNGFSEPLDTARRFHPVNSTDTSASSVTEYIYGDNNWKIVLPSINREFAFSDFQFVNRKCCDSRVEAVKNFSMNGRLYKGYSVSLPK